MHILSSASLASLLWLEINVGPLENVACTYFVCMYKK